MALIWWIVDWWCKGVSQWAHHGGRRHRSRLQPKQRRWIQMLLSTYSCNETVVLTFFFLHSELDIGSMADTSTSSSAAPAQKKAERPRANSSGSIDQTKFTAGPTGGSVVPGAKLMLQIPTGKQRRFHSPGNLREWVALIVFTTALQALQQTSHAWMSNVLSSSSYRYQDVSSSEDIPIKVDKVCLLMIFYQDLFHDYLFHCDTSQCFLWIIN